MIKEIEDKEYLEKIRQAIRIIHDFVSEQYSTQILAHSLITVLAATIYDENDPEFYEWCHNKLNNTLDSLFQIDEHSKDESNENNP